MMACPRSSCTIFRLGNFRVQHTLGYDYVPTWLIVAYNYSLVERT
jgi:hypothetical protein